MQASHLEFCLQLAKGIARQFGPNCEVVVHDLASNDPASSIVAIENGHVTGRRVGDGPSQVVLEALRDGSTALEDRLCYLTRTEDGKILKSSTIYLRDDDGRAVGVFSINLDITLMLSMEEALHGLTATGAPQAEPEPIARDVAGLLDELIAQSVRLVGRPVALMTREDKVRALQFLDRAGAFLITRAGHKVCKYFGISKYTLYSYLDAGRAGGGKE